MAAIQSVRLCDSCNNAADDEAGFELDQYSRDTLMFDLGADIADHICDSPESGETCRCACQPRYRIPQSGSRQRSR